MQIKSCNALNSCTNQPTGSRISQSVSQQPKVFNIHPNTESRVHKVGNEAPQSVKRGSEISVNIYILGIKSRKRKQT